MLRNRSCITDLIFIHGLDVRLEDVNLRNQVSRRLRQIAYDFNVNLIELETDIRHSLKNTISWGSQAHGSILASSAHLLDLPFEKVLIPSSDDCCNLSTPWGSHPLIDPLWSANGLKIIHDSIDMNRIDKGLYITGDEIAQQHLRVCYRNLNGLYNCGECRKCIKTMLILAASGSLKKFDTFEDYLDPELLRKQPIDSFTDHVYPSKEVDQLVSLLRLRAEENSSEECSQLALILERKVLLFRLKKIMLELMLLLRKVLHIFLVASP